MKKLGLKIIIIVSILIFWNINIISNVNAEWEWIITVIVTEKIPWATCSDIFSKIEGKIDKKIWFKCEVEKWFWSIVSMLWSIIKYFTFIASLWWVLYLVIGWIMYSMSWIDPWAKDKAKEWITKTIIWLILLLFSWVILNLIAPWIYK